MGSQREMEKEKEKKRCPTKLHIPRIPSKHYFLFIFSFLIAIISSNNCFFVSSFFPPSTSPYSYGSVSPSLYQVSVVDSDPVHDCGIDTYSSTVPVAAISLVVDFGDGFASC